MKKNRRLYHASGYGLWVTYVVLAPEHPLTRHVTTPDQQAAVEAFIQEVSESELERTAEDKPKRVSQLVVRPLIRSRGKRSDLIADYVLYEYGTGR